MPVDITNALNTPAIETVHTQWVKNAGVQLDLLRLDQLDHEISGNKWYKLKHNLSLAREQGRSTILSFGGVWSNHIHALAAVGCRLNMPTIGIIRGELKKDDGYISAMLVDAAKWGMRLHGVSRSDYRQKHKPEFLEQLFNTLSVDGNDVYTVPEGGSNGLGVNGCEDILSDAGVKADQYDEIWLACGTGATLAGIALAAAARTPKTRIIGVAALKGANFLRADIRQFIGKKLENWTLLTDYHHGGYARVSKELLSFIHAFEQETPFHLEPVYTAKALFALYQTLQRTSLYKGRRILMVHTGGLQGLRGFAMN